jgi:hypothetical protein
MLGAGPLTLLPLRGNVPPARLHHEFAGGAVRRGAAGTRRVARDE